MPIEDQFTTPAMPASPIAEQPSLSEPQRIVNTYVAPSKTFADIRRNASWWAPWVLISIFSWLLVFTVDKKVGYEQVTQNQIKLNPKAEQRMEQLRQEHPDRYEQQLKLSETITKGFGYCTPVLALLASSIIALVLMASFNFGLGTSINFKHALAIVFYGSLPGVLRSILASVALWAGANTEAFNFNSPVGTNPAYYLNISETPHWLYSLCSWLDVFTVWTFVLIGIGFAVVGNKQKSTGIAVLMGWYAVLVLLNVGWAAVG
ncbi:MAG TPA: YIP1 family protein [Terriglobales bacterium]